MSSNFVEELVVEYYRMRGYLVLVNYWFPVRNSVERTRGETRQRYAQQSWKDIDVLAVGADEVLLIQVKAIVNEASTIVKIQDFFVQALDFVEKGKAPDGIGSIGWWCEGKAIRKLLVYEYHSSPGYLAKLQDSGIEIRQFDSYFKELVHYIQSKNGVKEESALMRMIHFLNHSGYLSEKDANQ